MDTISCTVTALIVRFTLSLLPPGVCPCVEVRCHCLLLYPTSTIHFFQSLFSLRLSLVSSHRTFGGCGCLRGEKKPLSCHCCLSYLPCLHLRISGFINLLQSFSPNPVLFALPFSRLLLLLLVRRRRRRRGKESWLPESQSEKEAERDGALPLSFCLPLHSSMRTSLPPSLLLSVIAIKLQSPNCLFHACTHMHAGEVTHTQQHTF